MPLTKEQQEECDSMFKEWFDGYKFNGIEGVSGFQLIAFRGCYSIMIQRLAEKDKDIEELKEAIRVFLPHYRIKRESE